MLLHSVSGPRRHHRIIVIADRTKGALLVAGAALCWSSGGILLRLIDSASGLAMVFWRSLFMALAIGLWLLVRHRVGLIAAVRAVGAPGGVSALLLTGAFVGYVLSINETAVANTMLIMSASPLVAALLARILLGERLRGRTLLAIAIAFTGIAVMFGDEVGRGQALGNAMALMVAVCFGSNIVLLRRYRNIDMIPVMLLAGLVSAALTLPFAEPFAVSTRDVFILAGMGLFQLALGLFLFIRGTRYLTAAELGLLGLLETVCAPLWVWIGIGERPSPTALVGGALVLTGVVGQALSGAQGTASNGDGSVSPSVAKEGSEARVSSKTGSKGGGSSSFMAAAVCDDDAGGSGQASGSATRQYQSTSGGGSSRAGAGGRGRSKSRGGGP
ncbi:MAG: DMT family transporter [Rhodospirillales bacterium]|nr:DMT family transporter [Rhodospirillales bacterium]